MNAQPNNPTSPSSPWKPYQKIGFRFALIFFLLFIVLLDWSANPLLSYLYYYGHLATALDALIYWVGSTFFDISHVIVSPYDAEHNDRTYVYLLYFTMAQIAAVGTLAWSLTDRKRSHYEILYYWFTVVLRYYLAFTMFLFALYKFFRVQFPELGYYTLTETVGDMSPMHLAWAFFGYSHGYNIFMGLAESAGLLLLFRRTATFGSLLTMAALANVIAVNFSFDVHAKMYPTALFFMALFLLLRDGQRIAQFFFTGKAVPLPALKAPVFDKKWMNVAKPILKIFVIGYFLIGHVTDNLGYRQGYQEGLKSNSSFAGIYTIDTFVLNQDTLAPDHPLRWQQLVLGDRMLEAVRLTGDSIAFATEGADNTILVSGDQSTLHIQRQEIYNELGNLNDTYSKMDSILVARQLVSSFRFEQPDKEAMILKGTVQGDSVYLLAKRKELNIADFRLMKRRFHWVNEASYFY